MLSENLRERIVKNGPVTFAGFMDAALYDPLYGYYRSKRSVWGVKGDYLTTPDFGGIFASMLAKQIFEMWEKLGSPSSFRIVEAGAGRGILADGVLETLKTSYPDLYACAIFSCIEVNEELHRESTAKASWKCSICELDGPFTGCIYSNELLDAIPFHRVVMREEGLREIFVGWDGSSFCDVEGRPSTSQLEKYFGSIGVELPIGQKAEVSLGAVDWTKNAALLLEKGYLLSIDYGMPAAELYRPGRPGTLLCHYKHTVNDAPYERIGEQDITAHVDFTSVRNAGENAGLRTLGFSSQRNFLMGLGILDGLKELSGERPSFEDVAHNQKIKALIMPGGISDTMKVFAQGKGVRDVSLSGFSFKDEKDRL